MKREQFENTVRDQITRAVANALQSGVPSSGMLNRAAGEILKAADDYAFTAFIAVHYKHPSADRSACGRGLGGRRDPLEVTCASCMRTKSYLAACQEVA